MKSFKLIRFAVRAAKGPDGQPNGNKYVRAIFGPADRSSQQVLIDTATNKRVEHALTYWPDEAGLEIWRSLASTEKYKSANPADQDFWIVNVDNFVIQAELFQVPVVPHYRYYPQDVPGQPTKQKGMIIHDDGIPRVYTTLPVFATCDPETGLAEENLEAIAARRIRGIGISVEAYKLAHPDAPAPVIAGQHSNPAIGKPTAADPAPAPAPGF